MTPRNNKVLVIMDKEQTTTKAGIILATQPKSSTQYGTVEAVGRDVDDLKKGDRVLLDKYGSKPIDETGLALVDESEILAIL